MNFAQLQALWIQAGGPAAVAPIMAAIALAESSGNPNATNPTDNGGTQTSWGLWQISDGTHNEPAGWNDPLTNAQMAVQKYDSQGLGAWGTYTSGAYLAFLNGGSAASTFAGGVADQANASAGSFAPRALSKSATSMLVVVVGALLLLVVVGALHKQRGAK